MLRIVVALSLVTLCAAQTGDTCGTIKEAYKSSSCCSTSAETLAQTTDYSVTKAPTSYPLVETEITYVSQGVTLYGYVIYQDIDGMPKRPGLMIGVGPYGTGGGQYEREVGRTYAKKGMVVFLPDYLAGNHSDADATALDSVLKYQGLDSPANNAAYGTNYASGPTYPGGWFSAENSLNAQQTILDAYNVLVSMPQVDATKMGALGFCFGGAMMLNLARAGAPLLVAVSLHGEYPAGYFEHKMLGTWNTQYFVEMAGMDDPLIPSEKKDLWMAELANHTAGRWPAYNWDMQIWGNTVHAFSINYGAAFLQVLNAAAPGAIRYEEDRAAASFDRVDDLFKKFGLIA